MIVIAILEAKPGKEHQLETALRGLIPQVQTEESTLAYILHRAEQSPGKFLFYERYPDKAAFDRHSATTYLKETLESVSPLLKGDAILETYEEIAAIVR